MDPFFILVFAFILLLVLLVGGFVVLFPLTRRLGALLERRLEEPRDGGERPQWLGDVRKELSELRADVRRLTEQQEFMESLLDGRHETPRLGGESPPSEAAAADRSNGT